MFCKILGKLHSRHVALKMSALQTNLLISTLHYVIKLRCRTYAGPKTEMLVKC